MSSRVAPTRYLEPGRLDPVSRSMLRAVSPDVAVALGVSLVLALALAAFGPPGVDRAAHQHLTSTFAADGWRVWDNYWYAGRYELINYSPLYYPLAAFAGYLTVAVAAVVGGGGTVRLGGAAPVGRAGAPVGPALRGVLARRPRRGPVPVRARLRVCARGARRAAARSSRAARPLLPRVAAREPARLPVARRHPGRADGCTAGSLRAAAHARDRPRLRDRAARARAAARLPRLPGGWRVRLSLARPRGDHRLRRSAVPSWRAAMRGRARSSASSSPTSRSAGPPRSTRPRSAGTRRACSTTSRCPCWRSWPRSAGSVPVC